VIYYDGYHAAIKTSEDLHTGTCSWGNGKWLVFSSKCGSADVIEHVHDQLDDSDYGSRIRYYK